MRLRPQTLGGTTLKLTKSILTLALLVGCATRNGWSQPTPDAPRIGFFLTHDQTLRPLYGLPANVMVGAALDRGDGSVAFSSSAGLVHVGANVLLQSVGSDFELSTIGALPLNSEVAPVLGMSASTGNDGSALSGHAAIWLPSTSVLEVWTGEDFAPTHVDPLPGLVVSLLPEKDSVSLMVQVPGNGIHHVVVSLANGQIISNTQVDAGASSAHEQNGWTLLSKVEGLLITGPNGASQTLAGIPTAVSFAPVSDEWVHIQSRVSTAAWLVHLDRLALANHSLAASEIPLTRLKVRRVPLKGDLQ